MFRRMLIATVIAGVLMTSPAIALASQARGVQRHAPARSAARPRLPSRMDWEKIQTAAGLRGMALEPHRTARFRAFAAQLGLGELVSIHPLAPGPCLTAIRYLYINLLDLENAFPGENWRPLRQAVAREPSIQACAPRLGRR